MKAPAVSVIIPMYNAEKYIGACLDSILAQTFKNFELIIVDDCSTDSSCTIVDSYTKKFGGRLKLVHTEENSGGCAVPRNVGFPYSRGEYIFNMDADDAITKTALDEMYSLAKKYDADVVYIEKYYEASSDLKEMHVHAIQAGGFVDKPVLETEDLEERVKAFLGHRYWVTAWCKFVRRNFIVENKIFFPKTVIGEDNIWTSGVLFCAGKILRAPNIVYIYRRAEDSMTKTERTPEQTINFWLNSIILGLKSLDNFMSKHEFFQTNPQYRYAVLEDFLVERFYIIFKKSLELQPFAVYEAIRQEFSKNLGEYDVLVSALCAVLNTQQKVNMLNQQRIRALENELNRKG